MALHPYISFNVSEVRREVEEIAKLQEPYAIALGEMEGSEKTLC